MWICIRLKKELFKIISGILHLGNMKFVITEQTTHKTEYDVDSAESKVALEKFCKVRFLFFTIK
jgi:myosin heavy subunit